MERTFKQIESEFNEKSKQAMDVNDDLLRRLSNNTIHLDSEEFKEQKKLGNKLLKESKSLLKELKSIKKSNS